MVYKVIKLQVHKVDSKSLACLYNFKNLTNIRNSHGGTAC